MNRIEKYHTLRKLLKSINTNVYDVCVNGATDFNKKLDEINEIGRGHFGKIYLASINEQKFVVKEATVPTEQSNKIKYNKIYNEILPPNSYVEEYRIMEFLSDHVVNGGFPNFILSYKAAVCETCLESHKDLCFMTFMEPAICNFKEFIKTTAGKEMIENNAVYSIIYQLFLALCVLHLKYGIHHRDLSFDNILVLQVKPGGYFRYVMNEKEYLVENYGYLFCLHDFGISHILNPTYSSEEFYGTRNVLVNQNGLLEPVNYPFTIDKENIENTRKSDVIKWTDGRIGTDNVFSSDSIPMSSEQQVDLTDMKTFPPIEFYMDIKSLIVLFKNLYILPESLIEKFSRINRFSYDANSAIYLRADMMLDYLYEKPIGITMKNIKDTFYI